MSLSRLRFETLEMYVGDCQNYGPFLGPYYNTGPNTGPNLGDPKRDHNFDNHPCGRKTIFGCWSQSLNSLKGGVI